MISEQTNNQHPPHSSIEVRNPEDIPLPKITIVTPSFNQGCYLEKTILSVLNQNYTNLEYIIIDGGSSDNSVEIILKYEEHLAYWVSESDRGQSHAINMGLERATGQICTWLNSDDYLMPGALHKIAELYGENPDAGAFVGAGQMVDTKGAVLCYKEPDEVSFQALFCWPTGGLFTQPSCFFSREAWLKVGPLDEALHFTMDVDLWLKIAREYQYARCNTLISTSLIHGNAKTTAFKNKTMADLALVMIRHGGENEGRTILNELTERLTSIESRLYSIVNRPLVKVSLPILRKFRQLKN